jgi:hypothetical protein
MRTGRLAVTAIAAAVFVLPPLGAGHEGRPSEEPLSRYEQFVADCSPCVKESLTVATLSVPALNIAALSQTLSGRSARAGQILIETLHAHVLGMPSTRVLAVRVTLSIMTGTQSETYRLSSGIVDEEDVAGLETALGEIASAAGVRAPAQAATAREVDVHTQAVRVGVVTLKGESVAYVQAGDIHALLRRPVWDAPGTLYLAVADLARLRGAFADAAAKIRTIRGAS